MNDIPYIAVITAFHDDETVHYENTRLQFRRIIAKGGHLFCCGTNGDFASLTEEELRNIAALAVEEAKGQCRVIANAGCPSTFRTIRMARDFEGLGVDAVAAVAPYFISCTQEGLYTHYMKVADALSLPLYLYNIPARTGNPLQAETVRRLAAHPNIKGVKDSSGSRENLDAYLAIKEAYPDFEVMAGSDGLIQYGLKNGASGCVSGLGNIVPDWVSGICRLWDEEKSRESEALQEKLTSFRTELYSLGFGPALVKRAVYLMDPSVGNSRTPAMVPDPALDQDISDLLLKYGIEYS